MVSPMPETKSTGGGGPLVAAAAVVVAIILGVMLNTTSRKVDDANAALRSLHHDLEEQRAELDRAREDQKKKGDEIEKQKETLRVTAEALGRSETELNKQKADVAKNAQTLERAERLERLLRDPKAELFSLRGTEQAKDATGRVLAKGEELVLLIDLPMPPEGKAYELWAVLGTTYAAAGLYDNKGGRTHEFWRVPPGAKITGWALSLENGPVETPTQMMLIP